MDSDENPILPIRSTSSTLYQNLKSFFSLNSSDASLNEIGWKKASTVILAVLFICGVMALAFSAIIWVVYDELDGGNRNQTTTTTTPSPTPYLKRIVGVYTNNESKDSTNVQLEKLTHALFAFIRMDENGTLYFKNEKSKHRFLSLRNKAMNETADVKLMVSIGGPNNAQFFSGVLKDESRQRKFISSTISFLKQYKVHGVDIFWKWPSESEKYVFSAFIKNLRDNLNPYLLSITVPPAGIEHQTFGFDIDDLVQHVDFLNVYSMDYYGPWMNEWGTPTGPIAPLYSGVKGREEFNLDYTMQYYSSQTRQLDNFNIIIPTFVRLWEQVKDAVEPGRDVYRNVILKDNMTEGDAYMSRRLAEMEGWKLTPLTWDEQSKSSFIYYPDEGTYLTFETERSLKAKMDYLKEKHFGGVWIWTVDMDDENNTVLNFIRDFGYSTDEI
ncbi:Protein CBG18734 [Caenorhabditis briggsae]|uniref:Protein CBG18734 n=2 Tax=Caenorhabditis briggsae TaxID=6238 RepID=A8XU05_CAEBR|nr:Protein CBG18734 [Caenorhabditis briggsae]ULT93570.1 hypothetical protein L3Y34_003219 [Caenorhabditis briggsae]CAP36132.1 Protein CBG18734 [Caenorhabditis briggsae]